MMNIDGGKMERVIQEAFDRAQGNPRWQRAIARARQEIGSNPYLHFDGEALLILSPSNEIYRANGVCQCKAFERGIPCWHRAAARLVQRYVERSH
jgi:hypothetical protein